MPGLLAALAAGLVVGLERGWRDRDLPEGGRVAGLRTFALAGLLGGVLALGGQWLLAAGALGLAVMAAVAYRISVQRTGSVSVTSALALLLTFGLGALATQGQPATALSLAVLVAVLLDLKPALHRWLRLIERRELSAALQMLVISAVVLPLLPDANYGPYAALNPYRLWWAVVLVAGLSLSGHIAMRLLGPQRGLLWTGLLGGLASSTAATLTLARQARAAPALVDVALAGAWVASAVMALRIAVLVGVLAPSLLPLLLPPLLAAALALLLAAAVGWRRRPAALPGAAPAAPDAFAAGGADLRPFDLGAALGFGALLGAMAVLAEAGRQWLGPAALYGLAVLGGLADVDAVTISMARLQAAGAAPASLAATAIALAAISNLVVKAGLAWTACHAAFARRLALGYLLAALAAAGAAAMAAGPAP